MKQGLVIVVILVIAVLSFNQLIDHAIESANDIQKRYCENVAIYKQTNGRNGWPDYKGNAATKCPVVKLHP